ncbi:MAG: hypothetical protein ACRDKI_08945 [Solirubrobacterales bacterium]
MSVVALAAPRVDDSHSLEKVQADLASDRNAPPNGKLVVADDRNGHGLGHDDHGGGLGHNVEQMFIKKATVCMASQSQLDLLQQVFFTTWKTVKIDGVDTQVLVIRGVKNPHLFKQLWSQMQGLDCRHVNIHVAWLVFVFNPHMS